MTLPPAAPPLADQPRQQANPPSLLKAAGEELSQGQTRSLPKTAPELRQPLEAAASELGDDDVSGFAGYLQIGDIKGDSHSILFPKVEIVHLSATRDVIDYLGYKL